MSNLDNENLKKQIMLNNHNLDQNNFYINLNQINLINDIINFYQKNGMNCMNFNQKVQIMNLINHLNPDFSLIKQSDHIEDPLHYILEYKIQIKLINYDKILYNIKIPTFITKSDLYSIAKTYRALNFTNFILIHNNHILNEDESSINDISDNDIIIMIEDRNYPDNSYYESLIENKNFKEMTCIKFIDNSCMLNGMNHINLHFPSEITIAEMMKTLYLKFGMDQRDLKLNNYYIYDVSYETKKIQDEFRSKTVRISLNILGAGSRGGIFNIYGKKIFINFPKFNITTGILNSNIKLVSDIEFQYQRKVKKLYIDDEEIDIDIEKSLASLGITEDKKNCKVEFYE